MYMPTHLPPPDPMGQVSASDRRTVSTCGVDVVAVVTSTLGRPCAVGSTPIQQCVEDVVNRSG